MLQISCCSNSVPQSNTTVYITPSGTSVVPGLVAVMKAYQWKKAAIITENSMPFLMVLIKYLDWHYYIVIGIQKN